MYEQLHNMLVEEVGEQAAPLVMGLAIFIACGLIKIVGKRSLGLVFKWNQPNPATTEPNWMPADFSTGVARSVFEHLRGTEIDPRLSWDYDALNGFLKHRTLKLEIWPGTVKGTRQMVRAGGVDLFKAKHVTKKELNQICQKALAFKIKPIQEMNKRDEEVQLQTLALAGLKS
jgi:hypothetical protein